MSSNDRLKCSFCGKTQDQVKKLIAGPEVYICDECVELCNQILDEEFFEGKDKEGEAEGNSAEEKPIPKDLNKAELLVFKTKRFIKRAKQSKEYTGESYFKTFARTFINKMCDPASLFKRI